MRPSSEDRITDVLKVAVELDRWLARWRSSGTRPAAAALRGAWRALDDAELLQLDRRARTYGSPTWSFKADWRGRDQVDEVAVSLALFGSLSPDGHLREASLLTLTDLRVGEDVLVPIALIRSTDWVDEVAAVAVEILERVSAESLVSHLPLAEHLAGERGRGEALREVLVARLADGEAEAALRKERRHPDRRVRRTVWRRLLVDYTPASADIGEALQDEDLVVRRLAGDRLTGLAPTVQAEHVQRLRNDSVGQLRAQGLRIQLALHLAGPKELDEALKDKAAAVRALARFHWSPGRDPADVYRAGSGSVEMDIVGLAECGSETDVPWVAAHLSNPSPRLRAAALRALPRLGSADDEAFESHLDDPAPAVVRAAVAAIRSGRPSPSVVRRCAARALADPRPDVRQAMLPLVRSATWVWLETILALRDDSDEAVRATAERELRAWLTRSAHVATGPAEEARLRIVQATQSLEPHTRTAIEFVLRTSR